MFMLFSCSGFSVHFCSALNVAFFVVSERRLWLGRSVVFERIGTIVAIENAFACFPINSTERTT
jgi:hypothetical protein